MPPLLRQPLRIRHRVPTTPIPGMTNPKSRAKGWVPIGPPGGHVPGRPEVFCQKAGYLNWFVLAIDGDTNGDLIEI